MSTSSRHAVMGLVFLLIAFSAGYYVASNTSRKEKETTKDSIPPIVPPSKVTGDALELTATNELPATVKATPVALLAPKPETQNQGYQTSAYVFSQGEGDEEYAFTFQVRSGKAFDDFTLLQDTPYKKGKPMNTVKVDSDCPGYELVKAVRPVIGKAILVRGKRSNYKSQKQVQATSVEVLK